MLRFLVVKRLLNINHYNITHSCRSYSILNLSDINFEATLGKAITFSQHGQPEEVLNITTYPRRKPEDHEIEIQFLASPMNPSDKNQVQGVYPILPKEVEGIGSVPGNEGVAMIVGLGKAISETKEFQIGDLVLPRDSGFGTWRSYVTTTPDAILKLPKESRGLSLAQLATLSVNPCTAYRMLSDFITLKKGDTIIQNAANSGVGRAVLRFCHHWKINNVNLIRDRENPDETEALKAELKQFGATSVYSYKELGKHEIQKELKSQNIKLGFNAVGGKLVNDMLKVMSENAPLITYGAMSKQPITLSTSNLIFKNQQLLGFWMSKWNSIHSVDERMSMLSDIIRILLKDRHFLPKFQGVDLKELESNMFKDVLTKAKSQKVVFYF